MLEFNIIWITIINFLSRISYAERKWIGILNSYPFAGGCSRHIRSARESFEFDSFLLSDYRPPAFSCWGDLLMPIEWPPITSGVYASVAIRGPQRGSSLLKRGPGSLANGRGSRRLWSLDRDTSAPRRVPDRTAGRHVLASWRIPVFLRRICRRVPLICTILTLHDDVVRILSLDPSKEHVSGLQIAKSFPSDDVIQCRSGRTGAALAMGIPMPCLGRDPQREKWVCSLIFSSRG